ncbi:sigma-54-dependent transcriptional regulator [Pseudoalteromonas denitrificans]|uniref:DNA-binding transcriptional response regulator, NtrC family, contains REC, AAA-type ATPase, and a Fis-type DNA-binding domains n=1 Tax=Pseudoalteromonas denitrificans DSM 6059 TaxID=1123010 RepID=A0A1I1ES65_9GAMM|nr:sigma-54 dependent transcriptional regulator [Pseudoalteromonas denitrificans]SFB87743.1 DNA-binding transcriptional response regulator, NtrC family, contains REC, AAA-type ATPase, and a Fis-type DNA-binding domains [Pseudoalteromonas denitrificans DSM 6059]
MNPTVLVIDDNPDVIKALRVLFILNDIECIGAESPSQGLTLLSQQKVDLVIQDMNFSQDTTSGDEGKVLFHQIRQSFLDLPVILLTGWANLETAVELVKEGAADYLSKPWNDDKILASVRNLIELSELQQQDNKRRLRVNTRLNKLQQKYTLCNMAFAAESMLSLLEMATQIAAAPIPVLITGPNGAGKEKIAEVIQANSNVKNKPFIKVNVGALPADLLEAELFGAEQGAFTGAGKQRIGRFEAADGGTLFLDEIGNLSIEGQKKLLRVLQTGEFERLGSSVTKKVTVRVISATNENLASAITKGDFREDLYYRLNVIELDLPPLNQRKEDINELISLFIDNDKYLSKSAETLIQNYDWPGNVRELQNAIQRACLLSADNEIQADHLGIKFTKKNTNSQQEHTKQDIENALEQANGVVSQAAKALGLSRQACYRRMEKFTIALNKR